MFSDQMDNPVVRLLRINIINRFQAAFLLISKYSGCNFDPHETARVARGSQGTGFTQFRPSRQAIQLHMRHGTHGVYAGMSMSIVMSDQRERERRLTRFKEERDCSSICVTYLGGVINRTDQIVCG